MAKTKSKNTSEFNFKLKIINNSKGDLTKDKEGAFQMENWDFPDTIKKGEDIETTVSFLTGEGIDLVEDIGKVDYKTADDKGFLKISAFWPSLTADSEGSIKVTPNGLLHYIEAELITLAIT